MQIIVFRLKDLYFGLSTEYVEEITTTLSYTKVPKSKGWVQGLVNLRGDVLTLINLYNLLNLNDNNIDDCYNNTIVAQLSENNVALMVDEVIGVSDVNAEDFHSASEDENASVRSLVTVYDKIVNILDVKNLFEEKEE
ncbi:chemotaxis protein CheW [Carnobacteriaceae bacterium 52-44]|jgi:chemotaxis signal transduction protein